MSTEAEIKTIVGKCIEIEQRPDSDWVKFNIDVGSQYPVKLSTKVEKVIEEARGVGGDVASWTFKETQGNENPNKPGTHYMNRWLNKVEVGEHAAPATGAAGGTAPVQTSLPVETTGEAVDWDAKERRDYRSRAWAQTLGAFTHTIKPDEEPGDVFRRLQKFQTLVYHDVVRDLAVTDDNDEIPF